MQDIPGSEILWNLWAGIFAFVGVVDGGVAAWGKLYDWRMCKNI